MVAEWCRPEPWDTVIGYEYVGYDEDGDVDVALWRCAYHENAEDWTSEGCRKIRVIDTHTRDTGWCQCDRIGCELGWHQHPMSVNGVPHECCYFHPTTEREKMKGFYHAKPYAEAMAELRACTCWCHEPNATPPAM